VKFLDAVELLKSTGNRAVQLQRSGKDAAVLVSPDLVGRVMCSTFSSKTGEANAWINREAILKGKVDPVFNNFGGEERFWFGPEGGRFGLMFGGNESCFANYHVQEGMTSLGYNVMTQDDRSVTITADMSLQNTVGTKFSLRVERRISLLESCPYASEIWDPVDFVGFQSDNVVTNIGPSPWVRETGTIAMWCLGQFLEHPRLAVVIPVRDGTNGSAGPATVDEYFKDFCIGDAFQRECRMNYDGWVRLKADGKIRGKVGAKKERVTGRLGSYNPNSDHLIIVDHDFYPELDYATGYWRPYTDAFDGDAVSVYVDGPQEVGGSEGLSYELETMSPALFLRPGQSFSYRNRTFHLRARRQTIHAVCKRFLNAEIDCMVA
jgi:Family of unknown function (DUF6786)